MTYNYRSFQKTCPSSTLSTFDSNFSRDDFLTYHDVTHPLEFWGTDMMVYLSLILAVILFIVQLTVMILIVTYSWIPEAADEAEPSFAPGPGPSGDGSHITHQMFNNAHLQNAPI